MLEAFLDEKSLTGYSLRQGFFGGSFLANTNLNGVQSSKLSHGKSTSFLPGKTVLSMHGDLLVLPELGGGFKYFSFSPLFGEMIQLD